MVAPGSACPRSEGRRINPNFGPLYGNGPVYPAIGTGDDGFIHYGNSTPVRGWYEFKVLWVTDPRRVDTLIRGRQINGTHGLRFDSDAGIVPQLRIEGGLVGWGTVSGSAWGHHPSSERVQAPGCYAFQADGKSFSTVIVFQAAP